MKLIATLAAASTCTLASANLYTGIGAGIPDNNAAGISFKINVADTGALSAIKLTLTGLTHTWMGDLTCTLTHGADNQSIFTKVGDTTGTGFGDSSDFGGNYTFQDSGPYAPNATGSLWNEATLGTGAYVARPGTYYASAALTGTQVFMMTTFGGHNVNGSWTLFIKDTGGGDTGALASWTLDLTFVPAPGAAALLGLAGFAARRRRA